MNMTIVYDAGLWLNPSSADQGPFTMNTVVNVMDERATVNWVSPDGKMLRVTLPSFERCRPIGVGGEGAGAGDGTVNCTSMPLTLEVNGIEPKVLYQLSQNNAFSLKAELDILKRGDHGISAGQTMPVRISCPPFCPSGVAFAYVPRVRGMDLGTREVEVGTSAAYATSFHSQVRKISAIPGPALADNRTKVHAIVDAMRSLSAFGLTVSTSCENFGFGPGPDPGADIFTAPCMNSSAVRDKPCAYVKDRFCYECPDGAVCPGAGFFVFPLPGYWTLTFPYDDKVEKCPEPSKKRCPGFDRDNPTVLACGEGYRQGSPMCSACDYGYYPRFNVGKGYTECAKCTLRTSASRLLAAVVFLACLAGIGLIIFLLSIAISRKYGGTVKSSAIRSMYFLMYLFLSAQALVQTAKSAGSASQTPPIFREIIARLDVLQFSALSVPVACLLESSRDPFYQGKAQLIVMLIFLLLTAAAFVLFPLMMTCLELLGWRTSSPSVWSSSRTLPLKDVFRSLFVYRRLITLVVSVLFTLTCNNALELLKCDPPVDMLLPAYLSLENDRESLLNAGLSCDQGDPLCYGPLPPFLYKAVLSVSVLTSNPNIVCQESIHRSAHTLALWTIVVVVLVYPLASFALLLARLNWRVLIQRRRKKKAQRKETVQHKNARIRLLRTPCALLGVTLRCECWSCCPSVSRSATRSLLSVSHEPTAEVDSLPSDPLFRAFAGSIFVPSCFYFLQLGQISNFLLAVSLVYLREPRLAGPRLAANSSVLLGMICLFITTKPFKASEVYSGYVQISLLFLSFFVTLTGFVSDLARTGESRPALLGAVSDADAAGDASGDDDTGKAVESNPTVEGFAYLTLAVAFIVALVLLWSFFSMLRTEAKRDEESIRALHFSSPSPGQAAASGSNVKKALETADLTVKIDASGQELSFSSDMVRQQLAQKKQNRQVPDQFPPAATSATIASQQHAGGQKVKMQLLSRKPASGGEGPKVITGIVYKAVVAEPRVSLEAGKRMSVSLGESLNDGELLVSATSRQLLKPSAKQIMEDRPLINPARPRSAKPSGRMSTSLVLGIPNNSSEGFSGALSPGQTATKDDEAW
jgi:hypothetical protein